jgi:hypothetical protein
MPSDYYLVAVAIIIESLHNIKLIVQEHICGAHDHVRIMGWWVEDILDFIDEFSGIYLINELLSNLVNNCW